MEIGRLGRQAVELDPVHLPVEAGGAVGAQQVLRDAACGEFRQGADGDGGAAFHTEAVEFVFHLDEGRGRDVAVGSAVDAGADAPAVGAAPDLLPVTVAVGGVEVFREDRVATLRATVDRDVLRNEITERLSLSGGEDEFVFLAVLACVHGNESLATLQNDPRRSIKIPELLPIRT